MSNDQGRVPGRKRLVLVTAISAALLVPLAVLAGTGFAKGSPSSSQYQYAGKITICHHTHSLKHPFRTIRVSMRAWKGHMRHGDTMGACSQTAAAVTHGNGKAKGKGKGLLQGKGHGNGKANGHANGPKP